MIISARWRKWTKTMVLKTWMLLMFTSLLVKFFLLLKRFSSLSQTSKEAGYFALFARCQHNINFGGELLTVSYWNGKTDLLCCEKLVGGNFLRHFYRFFFVVWFYVFAFLWIFIQLVKFFLFMWKFFMWKFWSDSKTRRII